VDQIIDLYLDLGLLLLGYATLWFLISLVLKRNDIADVAWGLGYVLVATYCATQFPIHDIALLVYVLVSVWALRLSIYIGLRNRGKAEDFRYKQWREEWGKTFYWRSWLQVYVLQAAILLLVSSPIMAAAMSDPVTSYYMAGPGTTLWLIGFYWQVVGDAQLSRFKKQRTHKEEVLMTGLWRYSRHPNYFGEMVMWWGLFVIVLPLHAWPFAVISPLVITWLLARVSGVPMLEARYKDNEAYKAYKARTPALFPKLWK